MQIPEWAWPKTRFHVPFFLQVGAFATVFFAAGMWLFGMPLDTELIVVSTLFGAYMAHETRKEMRKAALDTEAQDDKEAIK